MNFFRSAIASPLHLLALVATAVVLSAFGVSASTSAYFTSTTAVASNVVGSATVALTLLNGNGSAITAMSFNQMVPGDIFSKTVQLTNGSTASTPIYVTTKATQSSALDGNTSPAAKMLLFRCNAACASATTFTSINEYDNLGSTTVITTSGGPPTNAPTISTLIDPTTDKLQFTNAKGNITALTQGGVGTSPSLVAGVPLVTAFQTTNTNCSTTNDGGCLLGGATTNLGNPATSGTSGGVTFTIPAIATSNGLAAGATDNVLVYVWLPTAATYATYGNLNSAGTQTQLTVAFTAVQSNGSLH